jgi:hypothetical protein
VGLLGRGMNVIYVQYGNGEGGVCAWDYTSYRQGLYSGAEALIF